MPLHGNLSALPAHWLEPRRLGKSKIRIGRLGLGLREIGRDPDRTRTMLMRAHALGLRYFDTAPSYGCGIAERRLGEALSELGRTDVVVSTKVGIRLAPAEDGRSVLHALGETVTGGWDGLELLAGRNRRVVTANRGGNGHTDNGRSDESGARMITVWDYSYDGVWRSISGSLERMHADHVNIVLIHDPEIHYRQAVRGAYRALDELRRDGTIGAIGVSMNQTRKLRRMADDGDFDAFLLAGRYSLLDQSAATEVFPVACERGIGVILAGVFNSGILANPSPGARFDYRPASPARMAEVRRLQAACERHGVSLKAAALQFSLSHPAVHTLLLGSTSAAELDESVELLQTPIPPDLWMDLRRSGLLTYDVTVPA